jgi:hypothetical protein
VFRPSKPNSALSTFSTSNTILANGSFVALKKFHIYQCIGLGEIEIGVLFQFYEQKGKVRRKIWNVFVWIMNLYHGQRSDILHFTFSSSVGIEGDDRRRNHLS